MNKLNQTGYLDIEYAIGRESGKALRYRLTRRTREVVSAIKEFAKNPIRDIIDLGTADGRMLDIIHRRYPKARCIGVEYSQELVNFAKEKFPYLEIVKGDIQSLNFPDNSFDLAIAAAVIEHIPYPDKVVKEAKRVLRPGGIFILTSPDPVWEHLATLFGHLKRNQHKTVMNLKQLHNLALVNGFSVLKMQKFMLSPVGLPFELILEKFIRTLYLDFLMANQLLVAQS